MVVVGNYRSHAELRKKPRRQFHYDARLQIDGSRSLVSCAVLDISEGGARLTLKLDEALPENFTLLLTRNGRTSRHCRTVWRDGPLLGVEFPQRSE